MQDMIPEEREAEHERRQQREVHRQLIKDVNHAARRYAEHDVNADLQLDFEEFLAIIPARVREAHSSSDIRTLFDRVDADESGYLSVDEFFFWSLGAATMSNGQSSLRMAFKKYDTRNAGFLDANQFSRMASEMGFNAVAHLIFAVLDSDGSGMVSYHELDKKISFVTSEDAENKRLLGALTLSASADGPQLAPEIDTSSWSLEGRDAATVRQELQSLMRESGCYIADLIKIFDVDADSKLNIDDVEFYSAMRNTLGYKGPKHVIEEIFDELDSDKNGYISFDEIFEFVRGWRHPLDQRSRQMKTARLRPPNGEFTLDEIFWDVETLRILIKDMLQHCRSGPRDLIQVWDSSGDGELSLREFLSHIQRLVDNERLWKDEVEEVARHAFVDADRAKRNEAHGNLIQGNIDVTELQRWLAAPSTHRVLLKDAARPQVLPPSMDGSSLRDAAPSYDDRYTVNDQATTRGDLLKPLPPLTTLGEPRLRLPPLTQDVRALRLAAMMPSPISLAPEQARLHHLRRRTAQRPTLSVKPLLDALDSLTPRYYPYLEQFDTAPQNMIGRQAIGTMALRSHVGTRASLEGMYPGRGRLVGSWRRNS